MTAGAAAAAPPGAATANPRTPEAAPVVNGDLLLLQDGDLYLVNANGANLRRITTGRNIGDADFSPNGARIVFVADGVGENSDLYVMRADGSRVQALTRTPDVSEHSPSWSRDGSKIGFRGYTLPAFVAYMAALPGATPHRVITEAEGEAAYYCEEGQWRTGEFMKPRWSPVADQFAVIHGCMADPNQDTTIDIIGARGKLLATIQPKDRYQPHNNIREIEYSPDGRRIAYTWYRSAQEDDTVRLRILDLDTKKSTVLAPRDPYAWQPALAWSPDGTLVAAPAYLGPSVYVIKTDGSQQTRVLVPNFEGIPLSWRAAR